jgi:hypothetical protein
MADPFDALDEINPNDDAAWDAAVDKAIAEIDQEKAVSEATGAENEQPSWAEQMNALPEDELAKVLVMEEIALAKARARELRGTPEPVEGDRFASMSDEEFEMFAEWRDAQRLRGDEDEPEEAMTWG